MDKEFFELSSFEDIVVDIKEELDKAVRKHGPINSSHEGYAVILEELDEFWDEVKKQKSDPSRNENMRKELIQVAAMCIRFIQDVIETDNRVDSDSSVTIKRIREAAIQASAAARKTSEVVDFTLGDL